MKFSFNFFIVFLGLAVLPAYGMASLRGLGRIVRSTFSMPTGTFKTSSTNLKKATASFSQYFKFPSIKKPTFFKKPLILGSAVGISAAGTKKALAEESHTADRDLDTLATECAEEVDRQLPEPLYDYSQENWERSANPLIDQAVFKRCNITSDKGAKDCAKLRKETEKKLDVQRWRQQDMAEAHESSRLFKQVVLQAGKKQIFITTTNEDDRNKINEIVDEESAKCSYINKNICADAKLMALRYIKNYWAALSDITKK